MLFCTCDSDCDACDIFVLVLEIPFCQDGVQFLKPNPSPKSKVQSLISRPL